MFIKSTDEFLSWLSTVLEPLCQADPNILAKYVFALVKKNKSAEELKKAMISQLDIFLEKHTKNFVDLLIAKLEAEMIEEEAQVFSGVKIKQEPPDQLETEAEESVVSTESTGPVENQVNSTEVTQPSPANAATPDVVEPQVEAGPAPVVKRSPPVVAAVRPTVMVLPATDQQIQTAVESPGIRNGSFDVSTSNRSVDRERRLSSSRSHDRRSDSEREGRGEPARGRGAYVSPPARRVNRSRSRSWEQRSTTRRSRSKSRRSRSRDREHDRSRAWRNKSPPPQSRYDRDRNRMRSWSKSPPPRSRSRSPPSRMRSHYRNRSPMGRSGSRSHSPYGVEESGASTESTGPVENQINSTELRQPSPVNAATPAVVEPQVEAAPGPVVERPPPGVADSTQVLPVTDQQIQTAVESPGIHNGSFDGSTSNRSVDRERRLSSSRSHDRRSDSEREGRGEPARGRGAYVSPPARRVDRSRSPSWEQRSTTRRSRSKSRRSRSRDREHDRSRAWRNKSPPPQSRYDRDRKMRSWSKSPPPRSRSRSPPSRMRSHYRNRSPMGRSGSRSHSPYEKAFQRQEFYPSDIQLTKNVENLLVIVKNQASTSLNQRRITLNAPSDPWTRPSDMPFSQTPRLVRNHTSNVPPSNPQHLHLQSLIASSRYPFSCIDSPHKSTPMSGGATPTQDSNHGEHLTLSQNVQSVVHSKKPRCRDFDEKGFCMRGGICPYDHGSDPVVIEDVGQGLSFSGPGVPGLPPPVNFEPPAPVLGVPPLPMHHRPQMMNIPTPNLEKAFQRQEFYPSDIQLTKNEENLLVIMDNQASTSLNQRRITLNAPSDPWTRPSDMPFSQTPRLVRNHTSNIPPSNPQHLHLQSLIASSRYPFSCIDSPHKSTPMSRGATPTQDSNHGEHLTLSQNVQSVVHSKKPRCRDFDEKGFCMTAETCPYDHGSDPVVIEDVGQVLSFSGPGEPGLPPPVNFEPPAPVLGVPPLPMHHRPQMMNRPPPNLGGRGMIVQRGGMMRGSPGFNPHHQQELISVPVMEGERQLYNTLVNPMKRPCPPDFSNDMMEAMPPLKQRFDYSRLGPRGRGGNCSLQLKKIPPGVNNIAHLHNHFFKFGKIVNIQVCFEGDPEGALITFTTHAEASAAYKSTEAVLNNRFIKVFWHNPDKDNKQENISPLTRRSAKERLGARVEKNKQENISPLTRRSVKERLGARVVNVAPPSANRDQNAELEKNKQENISPLTRRSVKERLGARVVNVAPPSANRDQNAELEKIVHTTFNTEEDARNLIRKNQEKRKVFFYIPK